MGFGSSFKKSFKKIKVNKVYKKAYKQTIGKINNVVYDAWKDIGDWVVDSLIEKQGPISDSILVNSNSPTSSLYVPYGQRRMGGTRVYLTSAGSKNKYLYSVLAICEGQVNAISSIEINDKSESKVSSKLRYTAYKGSATQSADAKFVSELSKWTSNHRLKGVAYLALRYEYDQDTYSGLPTATALIKGLSLYDPRSGSKTYSTNFALVILDYFRSNIYGVGITDDSLIDFESFKSSANIADSSYPSSENSSVNVKRFACNTIVDTSKSPLDNIKELVSESRGFLTNSAGQWRFIIQNDTTANHTITFDDVVGSISRQSNGARDKYNKVTVKYVDPNLSWGENEVTYPLDASEYDGYLEEDNYEESHLDLSVTSCTNRYQAIDIARQALLESRIGGGISFEGQPWLISVRVGDLIDMDVPGLPDNHLYRVSARTLTQTGEVSIQGMVYEPSIFPWIDVPDQEEVEIPEVVDASYLPEITSLTFLAEEFNDASSGVLKWIQSESAFVKDYQVEVYRVTDDKLVLSTSVQVLSNWDDEYQPSVMIPYLGAGLYKALVRSRNAITRSNSVEASFSVDVPILDKVTGLTLVGEFDTELVLRWNDLKTFALSHYRVDVIDPDNANVLASQSSSDSSAVLSLSLFKSLGFIRQFDVRVYAVNSLGVDSDYASLAVSKLAPAVPSNIQIWNTYDELKFSFTSSADSKGVTFWMNEQEPVGRVDANQVYAGSALSVAIGGLSELTNYHFSISSYDAFGFGPELLIDATTLQDAVANSIQQLTERDLTLETDVQALAKQATENAVNASINSNEVAESVLNAAVASVKAARVQQSQNDEYYRILNAVVEIDPASGVIVNRAYEYTNGKFSEAQILIDGANAAITLQAERINTTEEGIESANSQLQVMVGEINQRATYTDVSEAVAGAIDAIQPSYVTNFYSGLDGWSSLAGTAVFNVEQYLDLTLGDISTTLSFDGSENPVVQLVLSRDSAASWAGKVQYQTASHGYSSSYELPIDEITADGLQYTVIVDFSAIADYIENTVTGLRIVLGNAVSDIFTLHSVQAGKKTAAQTALEGLQGRVTTAEQSINAVEGSLDQYVKTTWYNANALTESSVNSILNSWDSTFQVLATLTELNAAGTIEKANTASIWIDGAEGYIQDIASTYVDEGVGVELTEVKQTLDAQQGVISNQIVSIQQAGQAIEGTEEALLSAAVSQAVADREQVAQLDSLAVAKKDLKAVTSEQGALALSVTELTTQVGDNQSSVEEYQRAAIGYCVDSDGNPTNHETAMICELITGHEWRTTNIAEAFKNVTISAQNEEGEELTVSAGSLYQAIVDESGNAAATATLLAVVNGQLAGIFANVGEDGSSLEFLANTMKFKTQNGTATPFEIIEDQVFAKDLIVKAANIENAAVGSAQIQEASIDSLHVKEGVIDSLHIKEGAIDSLHVKKGSIDSLHVKNGAIDSVHIGTGQIKSAHIAAAAIGSAQIANEIKSSNFIAGKTGWRILKSGHAEFNGPVISRELSVKSGTKSFGKIDANSESSITMLREEIIDTGYPSSAWSGTNFYTTCDAGFTSTSVAVYSTFKSSALWGVTADVLPMTRWSSTSTVHLIIRVYGRRVRYLKPVSVKWRLLRVS